MSTDDFEPLLTREGNARPIRNLWPLYRHYISSYDGRAPTALVHGATGNVFCEIVEPFLREHAGKQKRE